VDGKEAKAIIRLDLVEALILTIRRINQLKTGVSHGFKAI